MEIPHYLSDQLIGLIRSLFGSSMSAIDSHLKRQLLTVPLTKRLLCLHVRSSPLGFREMDSKGGDRTWKGDHLDDSESFAISEAISRHLGKGTDTRFRFQGRDITPAGVSIFDDPITAFTLHERLSKCRLSGLERVASFGGEPPDLTRFYYRDLDRLIECYAIPVSALTPEQIRVTDPSSFAEEVEELYEFGESLKEMERNFTSSIRPISTEMNREFIESGTISDRSRSEPTEAQRAARFRALVKRGSIADSLPRRTT